MSQSRPRDSNNKCQLSCFPYGVGHDRTEGVSLLLKLGRHSILLDCGLASIEAFQEDSKPPFDLVLCSHAHWDHARGLLALHEAFPQIPIYASEVTAKLLPMNWLERQPDSLPRFCKTLPFRSIIELDTDLTVELFPAGHLPGAAAFLLTLKTPKRNYKVFYTGDFCLSNFQLVEGLSLESLRGLSPDVLIIEGTYGTSRHIHRRQQEKQLLESIKEAIARQKSILLPVPTLGIGQEILKLMRSHHQFTGKDLDIWVDGRIAKAIDIYLELLPEFPPAVQNFAKHQPLFWDDKVCPRMRRLTPENRSEIGEKPSIVITHYHMDLEPYLSINSASWLVLIPEQLKEYFHPEFYKTETYLLAEHSDGRNTTQLIHNIRPQHIIFIHGSEAYLRDLIGLEELQNRYQLHSPSSGTLVELHLGDKFIQPAAPQENFYEGELNEFGGFVTITLPDTLNEDPRWQNFADTGIIQARWQGEELILKGVSQRELLSQTSSARIRVDFDCCKNCNFYRGQYCWNQASPLYGFKVTPEGYCPVFEPMDDGEG